MPYTVALPDGRLVEFPDNVPQEQAAEIIRRQMGGAGPQTGLIANLKSGAAGVQQTFANLGAELGLRDAAGAQQDIRELEAYRQRTAKPVEGGWSEQPWEKFKETLGGSLPYMVAPIAAGAVTGPVGAGLVSLAQFTGSNLERQRQEGATLGDADLGAAAAAAVPQAALDLISFKMLPGVRAIFAKAGMELTDETAKQIAKQTFGKKAADYMLQTGKAMSVEGATEVAQQVLERMQAGLEIDDPQARQEYFESFVGGAVLGGAIAPVGRAIERKQIKQTAARAARADEVARMEQDAQRQAQEDAANRERIQTPEYLDDLTRRYDAMRAQFAELQAAARAKPEKDDFFGQQQVKEARQRLDEFRDGDDFRQIMAEMREAAPFLEQRKKSQQDEQSAQQFREQGIQQGEQPGEDEQLAAFADSLDEPIAQARKQGNAQEVARLQQQQAEARTRATEIQRANQPSFEDWQAMTAELERRLDAARQRNLDLANEGAEPADRLAAAQHMTALEQARKRLAEIGKRIEQPVNTEQRIKLLTKRAQEAADKGENPERFLAELAQLQQQPSLFDEQRNKSFEQDAALGEEMGREREEAAARRQRVEQEIARLNQIGDRGPTSPEYLAALDRAMSLSDSFVEPQPPGSTLGLAPDKLAIYQKQQARRALRNMRQKAQQARTPLGEWAQGQRQRLIDQFRAAQAEDAQAEALRQREAQKQTRVGPPRPGVEPPTNLSDESDKRIASLIDALLPKAVGVGERIQLPQTGRELDQALLPEPTARETFPPPKPISSFARLFQPKAQRVPGSMGLDSERVLEQIRDLTQQDKDLSDQIKRAGNPKDAERIEAKEALKRERDQVRAKLEQARKRHGEIEGFADPTQAPEGLEGMGPERQPVRSLTEPADPRQRELFSTKPFQPKVPREEEHAAARTALVEAQDRLEKLRRAAQRSEVDPKFYREQATQRQLDIERLAGLTPKNKQLLTAAEMAQKVEATKEKHPEITTLQRDVRRFIELERLAQRGGSGLKARLQAAIEATQKEVDKRRQEVAELEARTRRGEQQQAANEGRDVGDLEADKINRGESDFRNVKGNPLPTDPKSPKSWSVDEKEKIKAQPPTALMRMQKVVDDLAHKLRVAELDYAVLPAQIKKAAQQLDSFYSRERAAEVAKELKELADSGITPLSRVKDEYEAAKSFDDVRKLAATLVAAEEKSKGPLQRAQAAANEAYTKWDFAKLVGAPADRQSTLARGDFEAKSRLGEALTEFRRARADRLELERIIGEKLRAEHDAAVQAVRAKKKPAVDAAAKAVREAEAAKETRRQQEHNAPRLAEREREEAKFRQQEEELERQTRIQTGLGLPGTRVERDTTKLTELENRIKRHIATADTMLDKAVAAKDATQAVKMRRRVKALNKLLDSVYKAAPPKAEAIRERVRPAGAEAVAGMRLPSRREGPLVRNTSGANKRAAQAGIVRLTASGMSQHDAVAVGLFTLKTRLDAAQGDAKARLEKAWKVATHGVEGVDALVAHGKKLAGDEPNAVLMGARQRMRDAEEAVAKLQKEETAPGSEVEHALAREKLKIARQQQVLAKADYKTAFDEYQQSKIKQAQAEQESLPESIWKDVETPKIDKSNPLNPFRVLKNFKGEDGKPLFRSSKPRNSMTRDAVNRAAERVQSRWKTRPDVVVVQSESELPFDVPDNKRGQVPGIFHDGAVYLVADNLNDANDVALTLAHEVAGHFGLRSMLGDSYARTMEALYRGNDKVRRAADAKMADEGLSREVAVEEVLAEMAETNPADSALKRAFFAIKQWLFKALGIKSVSDGEVAQIVANARRFVEEGGSPRGGGPGGSPVFRSRDPRYDAMMGRPTGMWENARDVGLSVTALKGRVQMVDRLGAFEEGVNRAEKAGKVTHEQAINAHYYARFSDNVNQAVAQFVSAGRVFIDKKTGTYSTKRGTTTLSEVFAHGGDGAEALGKPRDEANEILTTLAAGQRAEAIPQGWSRLGGDDAAKMRALYREVKAEVEANPKAKASFDTALKKYKDYNNGLIDFLHESGAITDQDARAFKSMPYAPYYRIEGDSVHLMTDKEKPIVIGNIKSQPELKSMLGDDNKILPLLEAATKNTYLIARMAMRNKQTAEMAATLFKAGFVSKMGKGTGPANDSTVHYRVGGEHHFAVIDHDQFGIPAELIVKGMEGIKTNLPALIRLMGIPAHWVRSFVTRMPTYAIRQMVRDPINAMFISGMDPSGVAGAFKNIGKALTGNNPEEKALMDSLVVTSNIYANSPQDMQKFIQSAQRGNVNAIRGLLTSMDELAQSADAATRTVLYEDARAKGMSHAEASLRALESMNFNRRGLSPSMHMLSTMIPFFNAQVQGMDVLYKALRQKQPFAEQLKIRQKLVARGMMLASMATAYALAMSDDEDYRKLKPQERYQNFHIRTPFTKDFVKIPIPYEVGVIFKALPEALIDAAVSDTKASDAAKGLAYVAANSIPRPWSIPAVGPIVGASLNQSGFGEIESKREQQLESHLRYRDTTPEALKWMGTLLHDAGIDFLSPMKQEYLVRSYFGQIGLGVLRVVLDPLVLEMRGQAAITRPDSSEADTPFIGNLFQRADGRFLIDRAYERMDELTKAKKTFDELVSQGQRAEALRYAQEKADEIAMADIAGTFRQSMGEKFSLERRVRMDPRLSAEEKTRLIERLRSAQNREAQAFYAAVEKRTGQRSQP